MKSGEIYVRGGDDQNLLALVDLVGINDDTIDQEKFLEICRQMLNSTTLADKAIVFSTSKMYGYCQCPRTYHTIVNTPRVCIPFDMFDVVDENNLPPEEAPIMCRFVYRLTDGSEITHYESIKWIEPYFYLVFLNCPDDCVSIEYGDHRIMYVHRQCYDDEVEKVFFIDHFGIPQCIKLKKAAYAFTSQSDGDWRDFNGQLKRYVHKNPYATITMGIDALSPLVRTYLNGCANSEAYVMQVFDYEDDKVYSFPVVYTDSSVSADKYKSTLTISGNMQIPSTKISKISVF